MSHKSSNWSCQKWAVFWATGFDRRTRTPHPKWKRKRCDQLLFIWFLFERKQFFKPFSRPFGLPRLTTLTRAKELGLPPASKRGLNSTIYFSFSWPAFQFFILFVFHILLYFGTNHCWISWIFKKILFIYLIEREEHKQREGQRGRSSLPTEQGAWSWALSQDQDLSRRQVA